MGAQINAKQNQDIFVQGSQVSADTMELAGTEFLSLLFSLKNAMMAISSAMTDAQVIVSLNLDTFVRTILEFVLQFAGMVKPKDKSNAMTGIKLILMVVLPYAN